MYAVEAVARLRAGEISPLELVEAAADRISEVESAVNPLQLVGKPRGDAGLLRAVALFEELLGLNRLPPIDLKPGSVSSTT
jgi:Asp-tRNA(Asn)/Glu-tRNA(Gln) amidotransferase A subunit family amidase